MGKPCRPVAKIPLLPSRRGPTAPPRENGMSGIPRIEGAQTAARRKANVRHAGPNHERADERPDCGTARHQHSRRPRKTACLRGARGASRRRSFQQPAPSGDSLRRIRQGDLRPFCVGELMWTKWTAWAAKPACSSQTDSRATAKNASDNIVFIRPRSRLSSVGAQRCGLSPIRRIGPPDTVRRKRGQTEGKFPHARIVEFAEQAGRAIRKMADGSPGRPETDGPN